MELLKGNSYIICFNVLGKALTFTCEILEDSENFVKFKDRYDKILTYNKSNIISMEMIE